MLYKIIRNKICTTGMSFNEYSYHDINIAYQICAQYTTYYCCANCGCQFKVAESDDVQPLLASSYWITSVPTITTTVPITYAPSYYTWIPTNYNTAAGQWTITSSTTAASNISSIPTTYTLNYT